jgi:diaminopimelate epimerase
MDDSFFKYHALGNDMVVIDPAFFGRTLTTVIIRAICDRHYGPGGDGICYGPLNAATSPLTMRFFNPDGSEAERSGNGLRIFSRYLWDAGYAASRHFTIAMGDGSMAATINTEDGHTISLEMGQLAFESNALPMTGPPRLAVNEAITISGQLFHFTGVSIGNPHCVIFSEGSLAKLARDFGPALETAPQFPRRTNVQFAQVIDEHSLKIEIWERGAGYTLASGTSASAAAGAAIKTGRCQSPVTVCMAGGPVQVIVASDWQVTLTGRVTSVYRGVLDPSWFDAVSQ